MNPCKGSTDPMNEHCMWDDSGNGSLRSVDDGASIEENDLQKPAKRRSFVVEFAQTEGAREITILLTLVAIAGGATIGVIPAVMSDRFARLNHGYTDDLDCTSYEVNNKPYECIQGSADAQDVAAIGSLVLNGLTFATSSLVGSFSDEYGRKGILILGILLSILSPISLLLIQLIPTISPYWYYALQASTGLINWQAVALSTLADVLPPKLRAPGIGLMFAGIFLGIAVSPSLSIVMDHISVSILSVVLLCLSTVVTILFLPETLPTEVAEETRRRRQEQAIGKGLTWALLRPIRELSILNRNYFLRLISILAFISGVVSSGIGTLVIYYFEERFAFDDKDVAMVFLSIGLVGLVAQTVLLKPLCEKIGEKMVLSVAFALGAINNIMNGLATNKATVFVSLIIGGFSVVAFPVISAMKANNVEASEQGRIQGALYSLQALAAGLGPVAMRYVQAHGEDFFMGPGAMFIFAGGLYVFAVIISCALPKNMANSSSQDKIKRTTDLTIPLSEQDLTSLMDDSDHDLYYGSIEDVTAAEDSIGF